MEIKIIILFTFFFHLRSILHQIYARTCDITGRISDFATDDGNPMQMIMPGDRVKLTVTLIYPIAIEVSMRFAIREGKRTVGAGIVLEILN